MGYATKAWRMDRALAFHLLRCCEDAAMRRAFIVRVHAALRDAALAPMSCGAQQILRITSHCVPRRNDSDALHGGGRLLMHYIVAADATLSTLPHLHRRAVAHQLGAVQSNRLPSEQRLLADCVMTAGYQQALAAVHLRLLRSTVEEAPLPTTARVLDATARWQQACTHTSDAFGLLPWLLIMPSHLEDLLLSALSELLVTVCDPQERVSTSLEPALELP